MKVWSTINYNTKQMVDLTVGSSFVRVQVIPGQRVMCMQEATLGMLFYIVYEF